MKNASKHLGEIVPEDRATPEYLGQFVIALLYVATILAQRLDSANKALL